MVEAEGAAAVPLERKGAGVSAGAELSLAKAASGGGPAAEESSGRWGERVLRGSSAGRSRKNFLWPAGLLRAFRGVGALAPAAVLFSLVPQGFA